MANGDRVGKDMQQNDAGGVASWLGKAWKIVVFGAGAVAILFFANGLSIFVKWIVLGLALLCWGLFEFLRIKKHPVIDILLGGGKKGDKKTQLASVRWGAGIFILVTMFNIGIDRAEDLIQPPNPLASNIYYMVVLDASENMKQTLEGDVTKWSAVQQTFDDFYTRSHELSNYGLVLIGGQNPREENSVPCDSPSVPLISLAKDGRMLPKAEISLSHLKEEFQSQKPQGKGSLRQAFILAKNELLNLPPDAIRVMVMIVNANDGCGEKTTWEKLEKDLADVNGTIKIQKELFLVDTTGDQAVENFADGKNCIDNAEITQDTNIQVVDSVLGLQTCIKEMLHKFDELLSPSPTPDMAPSIVVTLSTATTAKRPTDVYGNGTEEKGTIIPSLITVVPNRVNTETRLPSQPSKTPTLTLTLTPTFTFTPTLTVYVPEPTQTKKPDDDPKPTDPPASTEPPPPPPPTDDPCCKHCVNSQACGDSCISIGDNCTQPAGCACDG